MFSISNNDTLVVVLRDRKVVKQYINDEKYQQKQIQEKIKQVKNKHRRKRYCICKEGIDDGSTMIECSVCKDWFHCRCVNVVDNTDYDNIDFSCQDCMTLTNSWRICEK